MAIKSKYVSEAKKLVNSPESCVKVKEGDLTVGVHPMYFSNIGEGITKELDAMSGRYSTKLGGIPMAYENVKIVSSHGWLFDTNIYNHIAIRATFYVFCPEIGSTLEGVVRKTSKYHVACLVHGTYNVFVPKAYDVDINDWPGAYVYIGDVVKLQVTYTNFNNFIPHIKAELDPERVQELIDSRPQDETCASSSMGDNDSGILSDDNEQQVSSEEIKDTKTKKKSKKKLKADLVVPVENDVPEDSRGKVKKRKRVREEEEEKELPTNDEVGVKAAKKLKKAKSLIEDTADFKTLKIKKERKVETEPAEVEEKIQLTKKRKKIRIKEEREVKTEPAGVEEKIQLTKKCKKIKMKEEKEVETEPAEVKENIQLTKKEKKRKRSLESTKEITNSSDPNVFVKYESVDIQPKKKKRRVISDY